MDLQLQPFGNINLADPFFDSLKAAYPEFSEWYNKKALQGAEAYVFHDAEGGVTDFLYMKVETEAMEDVVPVLPAKRRLKVGTFKLKARGTRRGERFMKKIMDRAIAEAVDEIYVTIFPTEELEYLIEQFVKFGFAHVADKPHEGREAEWVLMKDMAAVKKDVMTDYPKVMAKGHRKWLLAIKPMWHTKLFPDSILTNESYDLVQDCTPTNGIYKTYISWNPDCGQMRKGDLVTIYRTSDGQGPSWYSSVTTSVCTVLETRTWFNFANVDEFLKYTRYSVFEETDRRKWFNTQRGLVVIRMLYNVAFTKRVIRKDMIEQAGMDAQARWSLMEMTEDQFRKIVKLGEADERYFID